MYGQKALKEFDFEPDQTGRTGVMALLHHSNTL